MPDGEAPEQQTQQQDQEQLPPELRGKTPKQITDFFLARESQWRARVSQLSAAAEQVERQREEPPPDKKEASPADWWKNPKAATEQVVQETSVSREEFQDTKNTVLPALINTCRMTMQQSHPDWAKFAAETERVMSTYRPEAQADAANWETAYIFVKGKAYDNAVKEAEMRGKMPSERVNPAASAVVIPKEVTPEQAYVAKGLNISNDKYLEGLKHMEEGKWPLTLNNVSPR